MMRRAWMTFALMGALACGDDGSGGDAGPPADAGDAGGGGDAAMLDAGSMDGGPADAGPQRPDAGMPCTGDCIGDVVSDFEADLQGVGTLRWRFLADDRGPSGVGYDELTWGEWDGLDAFVAPSDGPQPAVASCYDHWMSDRCAGIANTLLLGSDGPADGADATIEMRAPETGLFTVEGFYRTADGMGAAIDHELLLTRNARHDELERIEFTPSESRATFSHTVPLTRGDRLRLTVRPASGASGVRPVGLRARASPGGDIEDACQFAATFEGSEPLVDDCGGVPIENLHDSIGSGSEDGTTETDSLTSWYGSARQFAEGQYLAADTLPLDYSGDFTVQLWARLEEPGGFGMSVYADAEADPSRDDIGGVAIDLDSGSEDDPQVQFVAYWRDSSCTDSVCSVFDRDSRPTDGAWHFYRLVRDTEEESMSLCVDGEVVAQSPVPGDQDLTAPNPPHIGRNVVFNPANFEGAIDDVRVFDEALPCSR